MRQISCGRLENRASFVAFDALDSRGISLRARRPAELCVRFSLVAIGNRGVWFSGRYWGIAEFLSCAKNDGLRRLLVLTKKEYLKIVEAAALEGIKVDVFEELFPIFQKMKYNSNAKINFDLLVKYNKKLVQWGILSSGLSGHLSSIHFRSISRKIRLKNGFDRQFFFAYPDPYQEVFKLKEERSDRVIIALDFNSMYLDCMKGNFCLPYAVK